MDNVDELKHLREAINAVDDGLIELIAKRVDIVKQVGEVKKRDSRPIYDPDREAEVIDKLAQKGETLGLTREQIEKIWKVFFELGYEIEK